MGWGHTEPWTAPHPGAIYPGPCSLTDSRTVHLPAPGTMEMLQKFRSYVAQKAWGRSRQCRRGWGPRVSGQRLCAGCAPQPSLTCLTSHTCPLLSGARPPRALPLEGAPLSSALQPDPRRPVTPRERRSGPRPGPRPPSPRPQATLTASKRPARPLSHHKGRWEGSRPLPTQRTTGQAGRPVVGEAREPVPATWEQHRCLSSELRQTESRGSKPFKQMFPLGTEPPGGACLLAHGGAGGPSDFNSSF